MCRSTVIIQLNSAQLGWGLPELGKNDKDYTKLCSCNSIILLELDYKSVVNLNYFVIKRKHKMAEKEKIEGQGLECLEGCKT